MKKNVLFSKKRKKINLFILIYLKTKPFKLTLLLFIFQCLANISYSQEKITMYMAAITFPEAIDTLQDKIDLPFLYMPDLRGVKFSNKKAIQVKNEGNSLIFRDQIFSLKVLKGLYFPYQFFPSIKTLIGNSSIFNYENRCKHSANYLKKMLSYSSSVSQFYLSKASWYRNLHFKM